MLGGGDPAGHLEPALWNVGWRYLVRHLGATLLMVLGIAARRGRDGGHRPGQQQRQPRL